MRHDVEVMSDTMCGRKCPDCSSTNLTYVVIPKHRREWFVGSNEHVTEHWGAARDYTCRNCECEWTMEDSNREQF